MSNADIENDWSSTSTSPIYHHVVHEGDLTFYHYFYLFSRFLVLN